MEELLLAKVLEKEMSMSRITQSVYDKKRGMIMGYLAPGEDLIQGFKNVCQRYNITSGSISCIGSLSKVTIVQLNYEDSKMLYSNPIIWDTPVELLSGNGLIGLDENEQLDIHFHGVFVDHRKTISGGHFLEGGNPVAITIEFTILVSEAIQPVRELYQPLGFRLFNFYDQKEAE